MLKLGKKAYLEHRLVWFYIHGEWPSEIDHINGIKSDNRIENLRVATRSQNCANVRVLKSNKSGAKGVIYDKANRRWMAYFQLGRRFMNLGRFDSFDEAIAARKSGFEAAFGEFARHA